MSRFRRWSLGWFVVGLLGWTTPLWANNPEPEYLTVRDGLPQGFIKSLIQDRRGFIWLATRDGLCRYDGVRFRTYNHDPQRVGSLSFSSIYEIREDADGKLWLRTENNNVDCFDPVTEQTRRVSASPQFSRTVGRDPLVGIYPDRLGNVWVATQTNGFFRLNPNGTVSHHHWPAKGDTVQRHIHALLLDRQGRPWLAARDGLFRYNPASGKFAGFRVGQGLPQNDVRGLHERANGELMLGFPGRFALFNPAVGRVRTIISVPNMPVQTPLFARDYRGIDYVNQNRYTDKNGLVRLSMTRYSEVRGPAVRLSDPGEPTDSLKLARFPALSLLVDRSNVLWIGTNGDGVIKYDLNKRLFAAWPYRTNFHTDWLTRQLSVPPGAIPAVIRQQDPCAVRSLFDRQKKLWISSTSMAPYRYNPASRSFETVRPAGIESRWLPAGQFRMTALAGGPQGELWGLLGPDNRAVVRHNPEQQTFTAFPLPLPKNHPYEIMAMTVDGGRIYLATKNHGLLRADLSARRLIRWRPNPADPGSLPNDALLSLAQDPAQYNHLWIGTFGSGLSRLDKMTGRIRRFTTADGLPNNVIYAILPDGNGHLWLSTNRGLCRFDSRTFEVRNYTADDGLPNEEFDRHHRVALPDGRMVFGGIGGYTVFDPRRIGEDRFKPVVALTSLRINNQLVNATNPDSPIRQDINETPKIRLNYLQNFLSFDFAALQFNQSGKNQYRHKLTGVDDDWVYSDQTTATYTNLSPAAYTFVVNASNTSGVWSPYTRRIQVVIEPPLWRTWWAYAGYALLLLGAIGLYLQTRINRVRLRSQIELREQESVQLKNLDEVKSRFFANITHEFRTPLTLILAPIEQLLQEVTHPQHQNRLALVYRNANRLLRLINELLDLAKLEAGSLTVTLMPGDLADFVDRTTRVFAEEAQRKHVRLQVRSLLVTPHYWFDGDKVEKILNNLIANALRFTGEGGSITVSVIALPQSNHAPMASTETTSGDVIRLTVADTGEGIDKGKLTHVFNRFYQAGSTTNRAVGGSGIGLALVKELVGMMHGTVGVESRPGIGTTFVVELPCRPAYAVLASAAANHAPLNSTAGASAGLTVNEGTQRLLLVEDNDDIADYILSILEPFWRVRRAVNGREGIDIAIADGPDLIISDVLMPELDGYELCRQLKNNPLTSHIPILLLTAKTAPESRIEGLNAGADDYINKPFQVEELLGRIRNRLEQQERSRHHYRTQLLREGHLPVVSHSPDDEFMNRVYAVLEERLDDSSFGVEPMANVVGMSRMHLNRKIKAMTGMTPNELIRVVRLNRATELLLTGASVSEAADRVGFDTPAYFSKVFKEQYHLTPSEFIEKNRHEVAG